MKDIMSIKKRLEQKSAINGKAGVAIMSDMLNDEKIRNLVIKHYNSITCENEMKPEIILGDVPVFSVDTEGEYSLQGTTQGRYLTGGVPPVRFSM